MIKIPKKPSYKYPSLLPKSFLLRVIVYLVLFFLLYVLLPLHLTIRLERAPLKFLSIFYLFNILILFYYLHKNSKKKYSFLLQAGDLQEKINVLSDQNSKELKNKIALQDKIGRYNSLKNIIEEVNRSLALDSIAEHLCGIAFSMIADSKGVCILYLVNSQNRVSLSLFKTKKEDSKLIIKAKEGDIFDHWVLRHASPLLIEDIKVDFRFDLEKLKDQDLRPIFSLISAPLITENTFLGILRLDSPKTHSYSQDDIRFLVTICDLGAVALENGELFQQTQELAIHDGLTALFVKGYFLERLKEEYKRSARQGVSLSLLMLDIDHFKIYNDKFGHTAGDIVLKNLSSTLVEFLKGYNCLISRFGGEEFCVMLSRVDKKKAHAIAEELCKRVEEMAIILRRQETKITVSIGVAAFPDDAGDETELIIKADRAMYAAKQKGRNQAIDA